ncbi:MAG: hypothetical protein H0W76_16635 [Pyrinomonadaceae bacterium]|nr:hypothetical protein [Pyrinomonadaceae bacterium]
MNTAQENHQTIFLVEEDDDTRPVLKRSLQTFGYRVMVALDEEDAIERVGGGGVHANLILINCVRKTLEEAVNIGRHIRDHASSDGHTPLIVIAEKYGEDLAGTDEKVGENDWFTYPEDADQLRNLISRLIKAASAAEAI